MCYFFLYSQCISGPVPGGITDRGCPIFSPQGPLSACLICFPPQRHRYKASAELAYEIDRVRNCWIDFCLACPLGGAHQFGKAVKYFL